MGQDVDKKAELAVDVLMRQIHGEAGNTAGEQRDILLPVTLVTRKSTRVWGTNGRRENGL